MEKILFLIGLLPLIIVCFVLILKKKKFLFTIPTVVVTVGIGVASVFLIEGSPENKLSEEKYNYLCEMNLAAGNYDVAAEYLERMNAEYGDTKEVLTAQLRLAVLTGDLESLRLSCKEIAAYPEQKRLQLTEEEATLVSDVIAGNYVSLEQCKLNLLVYESVAANVENPAEYGIVPVTTQEVKEARDYEESLIQSVEDVLDDSLSRFSDRRKMQGFIEAVDTADKLQAILENPQISDETDQEQRDRKLNSYVETLTELYEEDAEVFALPEIKKTYFDGCIRAEKQDKLVEYAEETGDIEALSVVAYLYISDVLDDNNLAAFDRTIYSDGVVEKCEEIYERLEDGKSSSTKLADCEKYLDAIVARDDNSILFNIETQMANAMEQAPENVEALIQSAAINSVLADKDKVYESIDRALECKEECENEELADLLQEIEDIADNVAEDDEIIKFEDYLGMTYAESLPITVMHVDAPEEYLNIGNTYVNEKRAMVNVGNILTEDFPVVKAYVSTLGIDLTKLSDLTVIDCGMSITDFKVEKVKYDGAQIVLVCDNSGSMSGDVGELQAAVEKFISTKSKGEQIGIVTFDDTVLLNTGISEDDDVLLDAVDKFDALGGTHIAVGVNAAFGEYVSGENMLNVMVVMTDGQDSSYSSHGALEALRAACLEKNVVLYTIGLGSVNVEYLKNIADSGMGSFVYSSSGVQLEDLYTFIHNQVESNYVVTYTAPEVTTERERTFTISSDSEDFSATRSYSLSYGVEEEGEGSDFVDVSDDISVTKLGISTIIKSSDKDAKYEFTVLGSGLDRAENLTVSIEGDRQYAGLKTVVDSPAKMTVTLPEDVACDNYNVKIVVDGVPYTLNGLKVLKEGKKQKLTFGDYVFEAYSIDEEDGMYSLSGNVTLGDYLLFNGDVVLRGSAEGNILVLEEENGSYISGTGILPGLLAQFFDNKIELPSLDGVTLYKEENKYDMWYTHGKSYYGPLEINNPYIEVCPQYLNYSIVDFSFDFPILDNILEYEDLFEPPFAVSGAENKVVLGKGEIGIVLNVEADVDLDHELEFGPAELELDSFELEVNTYQHDYALGLSVELEDVPILGNDESVYGFKIGIKSGRFDSFDLGADLDIDAITLVPPGLTLVTLSDFHAGVEGMAGESQDASFGTRLLGATFYGQADVNFFKLNEIIPGLDTFLGDILDIAVLKMDDTKLGLTISNFNMSLDTKAVLLETVELGRLEADLGHYRYDNFLLDIDSTEVAGIHLKTSMDHKLDFGNNFEINVAGSGQIDVNKLFAGFLMNGDINYNIKIFKKFTNDLEGNCLIGVHNKGKQFTVLIKGDNHKSGDDAGVRVTFTKDSWFPEVDLY